MMSLVSVKEVDRLKAAIDAAQGSTRLLKLAFSDTTARIGHQRASELWWAAFAEQDAAET
jgi:hypothetical protein